MATIFDLKLEEKSAEFQIGNDNKTFVDRALNHLLVFDGNQLSRVDVVSNQRKPLPFEGVEPTILSPNGKMLLCKREIYQTNDVNDQLSFAYCVVDTATGETIFHIEDDTDPKRFPRELLFSRDNSAILVKYIGQENRESNNDAFTIWSVDQRKKICELGHDSTTILASSRGYEKIVGRSSQGVQLFDGRTGDIIATLPPSLGQIDWAEFSFDGKHFIAQELSNQKIPGRRIKQSRVSVWSAETGKLLFTLPPGGNHYIIGFTPGDQSFLTINAANMIQSWPMKILPKIQQSVCREMTEADHSRYSAKPAFVDPDTQLLQQLDMINRRVHLLGKITAPKRNEAWNLLDELLGLLPENPTAEQKDRFEKIFRQFHNDWINVDPVVLEKVSDGYSRLNKTEIATVLLEQALRHRRSLVDVSKVDRAWSSLIPKIATFQSLEIVANEWNPESKQYQSVKNWVDSNDESMSRYLTANELVKQKKHVLALEALRLIPISPLVEDQPVTLRVHCLTQLNQYDKAFDILTQSLKNDYLQTQRVTNAWLRIGLQELARSPGEMLDVLPNPSPLWIEDSFISDARWLLERLARKNSLRINCGSYRDTFLDGKHWSRDRFFNSGFGFFESLGEARSFVGRIQETEAPFLFQTERWFYRDKTTANQGYSLPLPRGKYSIRLGFAEIYPSDRDFDIIINGKSEWQNYDPGEGKDQIAVFKQTTVEIKNGMLDISFKSNNATDAKISFIEIVPGL